MATEKNVITAGEWTRASTRDGWVVLASTQPGTLVHVAYVRCHEDAIGISSLPNLLAACELAIDRPGWQPIPEDERDIIRAALAKARGEA